MNPNKTHNDSSTNTVKCIKCGGYDFEYDTYFNEYICKNCGWVQPKKGENKFKCKTCGFVAFNIDNAVAPEKICLGCGNPMGAEPVVAKKQEHKKTLIADCGRRLHRVQMNEDGDIDEASQGLFLRAIDEDDASAVHWLISSGVHPDSNIGFTGTPLMAVAVFGQLEVAKTLIEAGANVNLADDKGETALSLALAAACNPPEEDEEADEDEEANAAFWQQAFLGPHVQIARLLLQSGARVDTTNDFINRFFMVCCSSQGCTELVKTLLDHGADVNARDAVSSTPLMYAMSEPEIFRLLLERGADVTLQCDVEITVLDVLLCEKKLDLAQLVVDHGADVNERNYYLTRAVEDGEVDVVQFLLRNGADANQTNDEGESPSYLARLHDHRDIALLLRQAHGLPKIEASIAKNTPTPTQVSRQTTLFVRCPFCSTKNRIPSDRVGQRAKCGSCGQIISEAKRQNNCKLCNLHVSDGIHLSNGEIIHKSCLESIQAQEENVKNDIHEKQEKLKNLQSVHLNRGWIGFKLK